MGELLVVRHGRADGNVRHRFLGWSDVALDPHGTAEAEALAVRLRVAGATRIVTSDIARTVETADIVARRTGLPIEADPRVREINNGAWTFLLPTEIAEGWPELWAGYVSGSDVPRPQGERWAEVTVRIVAAFSDLLARPETSIVVTHGGPIIIGAAWALGITLPGNIFQGPLALPANGSVTTIAPGPKLVGYNDIGHLGGIAEVTIPYAPVG